mmetsp:Transcript_4296/g.3605  ORF Transcript_4296/g.3605 Transcript_4296/m.3605 type:complete len:83 (+) Transcript_4296:266-514(+)
MELYSMIGLIDDTDLVKDSKVFIYASKNDNVVNPTVTKMSEKLYKVYNADVQTEYGIAGGHAFPTKYFGNNCTFSGIPFINN